MTIQKILSELVAGQRLSAPRAEEMVGEILAGRCDDAQIAAAAAIIQARGVTHEELTGGARAMRSHLMRVSTEGLPGTVIDTCGTGGTPKTFNISTVAAFVVAGAARGRVHVAKHGNRSRSGRGSAEVLAALGVNVEAGPEVQARCLREAGVCFCFAIRHHPAARHAAGARRSLGFPTMFNLLGPLCNPAGATRQLVGVFDAAYVEPMAWALAELGSQRAMVVHGRDGMDEISTTGATLIAHVENGTVRVEEFDAVSLGVPRARMSDLSAETLEEAAQIARRVLAGEAGPAKDIAEVNAAAALWIAGAADSLAGALTMARASLDSGAAAAVLGRLIEASGRPEQGE